MTPSDRVALYNQTFGQRYPGSRLCVSPSEFISGVWILGNAYKGSGFFGSYPPQYLKRVSTLFPEALEWGAVMHLFSGSLPVSDDYTRVDLRGRPDYVLDAHKLRTMFGRRSFNLIYADPPYSKEAAARYGLPMINRKRVLEQCAAILRPGGFVVWLDTVWPMIAKKHLALVGAIGILRSQNHVGRFCFIMEKPR